jgi:ParB/RepB/Spo0J family partition protein
MANQLRDVPLALVDAGDNDRTDFDDIELKELAESIHKYGLAQPPTFRPLDQRFQIVMGERRTRAARMLGWETIPAFVRDLTDEQAADLMLIENLQRSNLNPMDEARAYQKRIDRFGLSPVEVAARAKVSDRRVQARLALLSLIPEAQKLIADRQMKTSFGEVLAPLDHNRQYIALAWFNDQENPLLRQFRVICGELLAAQAQEQLFDIDQYLAIRVYEHDQAQVQQRQVSVPLNSDLPPFTRRGTLAASLEAYIQELRDLGHNDAALIVGTLYAGMLKHGFCHPPRSAKAA